MLIHLGQFFIFDGQNICYQVSYLKNVLSDSREIFNDDDYLMLGIVLRLLHRNCVSVLFPVYLMLGIGQLITPETYDNCVSAYFTEIPGDYVILADSQWHLC
jgi:hypothetical protein